eukprot:14857963-Alexandrium_andersonii.AAC.1
MTTSYTAKSRLKPPTVDHQPRISAELQLFLAVSAPSRSRAPLSASSLGLRGLRSEVVGAVAPPAPPGHTGPAGSCRKHD